MAQYKRKPVGSWHKDLMQAHEDRMMANPIVRERWSVVDFYPSVKYSNEYEDGWTDQRAETASQYFETEEEAEDWMELVDPERGAELQTRHEYLRRFTDERWVTW